MEKTEREVIEWTNTWWAEANTDARRGLLIGDSTTRQLRGSVERFLNNVYAIDLFAASFSIYDRRLEDHIDMLFKYGDYKYDFIVLNYGGHHGFSKRCSESTEVYQTYSEKYTKLLKYLLSKCDKVICATGTSEVLDSDVNTIDPDIECEIIARNQIVLDAAYANHVEVFDLYGLMKRNRDIYTYRDRQHFYGEANCFISYNLLLDMLSKNIISKELIDMQHIQGINRLIKYARWDKKYLIYGAGVVGKELYWMLKWYGIEEKISCFVATHRMNNSRIVQKEIKILSELAREELENSILVIASDKYADEMNQMAINSQIKNVIFYRDLIDCLI